MQFVSDGGAAVPSLSGPDGSAITLPSDTWPGHVLDGWFTAARGGIKVGLAGWAYPYGRQSQPKNTSASANSSGDTSLRTAVASANGTSSMAVPCRATIWPECPSCKASTA